MFTKLALLHFHELAHDGLARLLAHVETLPQEKFRQELEGYALPSLRAQLCHMLDVENFWVLAIQGQAGIIDAEHASDLQTAAELAAYRERTALATRAWLATETDASLNTVRDVNDCGWYNSGIPADMLLHLMTHAYHHKGQIVAMCRLLGYPAPMTDLVWTGLQLGIGEQK
jgi:uncharacterized damage-inducible protein DinB